jgi:transcriptional regulator with XRE-family HTH domain
MAGMEYAKLKGRIVEKFGTRKAFAEYIGLSENSMSKKMNGITSFSQEDIVQWSKALDIDLKDAGFYFFA